MLFVVISGVYMAAMCALCAVQPDKVAAYVRRKHLSNPRWVRNWPFAGMVMKEWYPVYLRLIGTVGFVFMLVWLTLVIRFFSK